MITPGQVKEDAGQGVNLDYLIGVGDPEEVAQQTFALSPSGPPSFTPPAGGSPAGGSPAFAPPALVLPPSTPTSPASSADEDVFPDPRHDIGSEDRVYDGPLPQLTGIEMGDPPQTIMIDGGGGASAPAIKFAVQPFEGAQFAGTNPFTMPKARAKAKGATAKRPQTKESKKKRHKALEKRLGFDLDTTLSPSEEKEYERLYAILPSVSVMRTDLDKTGYTKHLAPAVSDGQRISSAKMNREDLVKSVIILNRYYNEGKMDVCLYPDKF